MIELFELLYQLSIFKSLFYLIGFIAVYQVINRYIKYPGQSLKDIGRGLNVLAFITGQLGMRYLYFCSKLGLR
ncbi:MAG: hypothetical protein KA114_09660 [Bacteroidales bacterium]|nr:hypothetical protein [Bacteroidales bacterium]